MGGSWINRSDSHLVAHTSLTRRSPPQSFAKASSPTLSLATLADVYERLAASRTPSPPVLASPSFIKITPAWANALRIASTFAAVLRLGPSGPSMRRIVGNDSLAASAS